jgi:hypothetical protein
MTGFAMAQRTSQFLSSERQYIIITVILVEEAAGSSAFPLNHHSNVEEVVLANGLGYENGDD